MLIGSKEKRRPANKGILYPDLLAKKSLCKTVFFSKKDLFLKGIVKTDNAKK